MALKPTFEEQERLAETFRREGDRVADRELLGEILIGGGFLLATALVWWAEPPLRFAALPSVLCIVLFVMAMRVRFDTPLGFTVPTQLAFVPLLFAIPAALVPLAVMIAVALARVPDVVTGAVPASRLLQSAGNSWFAVGPAAVFAVTGVRPWDAGLSLLLLALAAQFALDFLASSTRYALGRGVSLSSQLSDAWVYGVDAALAPVALVVAEEMHTTTLAVLSLVPLLGLFDVFARERHLRMQSLVELNNAYRGTALLLGDVVEADDGYTGTHSKGVVSLALEVADQLELASERRRNLEFAALLHDVGKIAVPKQIINKPGELSPEEWTIIKTHTIEGQKMLDRVGGFMREVGNIVRSHHERWDGSGYPDALAGEQIPLEARIIACCDTWNAMRTDRPYRKALSYAAALAELHTATGTQLDPRVADALLAVVGPAMDVSQSNARRPRENANTTLVVSD
jgi:putative nucleotidyltransferase with HDIG domain